MPLVDIDLFNETPWTYTDDFIDVYEGASTPATQWHPGDPITTGWMAEATFVKDVVDTDGNPQQVLLRVEWVGEWGEPDYDGDYDTEVEVRLCELVTPIPFQFVEHAGTPKEYVYDDEDIAAIWCGNQLLPEGTLLEVGEGLWDEMQSGIDHRQQEWDKGMKALRLEQEQQRGQR